MLVAHEHKSTGAHDEEEQAQPQTGVEDHSAHRVPQMLHRGILFHRIIPNYRLFRFDRAAKRVDRRRYRTCQGEGHESAERLGQNVHLEAEPCQSRCPTGDAEAHQRAPQAEARQQATPTHHDNGETRTDGSPHHCRAESADRHVGPLNHRIQAEAHSIDQGSGHSERLGNARRPAGHGSEPQRQGRHEPCDA